LHPKKRHYLGPINFPQTFCISTPNRDAVATFGPPVAAQFHKVLNKPLELTRLYQVHQKRQVSQFLMAALRLVR
jgi:hypothetical protein